MFRGGIFGGGIGLGKRKETVVPFLDAQIKYKTY